MTTPATKLIRVARCIYRLEGTKTFFHSARLPGKQFPTKRKLTATTVTAAIREVETLNTRRREAKLGVGLDPYIQSMTVGDLASQWENAGCADRKGIRRKGHSLEIEKYRLKILMPFWAQKIVIEILAYEDCPQYHQWRISKRDKEKKHQFRLGRSVDAELMTLSNLFTWAVMNPRRTGLKYNPLGTRPRFEDRDLVRHCTDAMPNSDEDFHRLGSYLLSSDITRPLGWQHLLEGLTGARTSEILACRLDAIMPDQPGYIDHGALTVKRLKGGIEPFCILETAPGHSPLRDCLQAFLNWHEQEYPNYPWFIPGKNKQKPAGLNSLTHALHRACNVLKIPNVVSHGNRAYFVAVMRSMGRDDEFIADCLAHRNTTQVQNTYGKVRPGWRGSWKMDFLPNDFAPAWQPWMPKVPYQKLIKMDIKDQNALNRSVTTNTTNPL